MQKLFCVTLVTDFKGIMLFYLFKFYSINNETSPFEKSFNNEEIFYINEKGKYFETMENTLDW